MTGSRAERRLGAAFAAVLLLAAAPGLAQTAAPPAAPSAPPQPVETAPAGPAVEVGALGTPDGPAVGLIDAEHGGMAGDIWSASERAVIEDMMTRLPLATPVRAVRALARKLVLTAADAPLGQAPHAFQTVRIRALLNGGLVDEAAQLALMVDLKGDLEFARVKAEAILLAGDAAQACSDATAARQSEADPFWMQLRAYCYAAAGQDDFFELTRGVMKAQGIYDKGFDTLLNDFLAHKTDNPGELRNPTAVELFLLRQAGLPVGPDLAAKFGLAASILALHDARNPPPARAAAAEQALHTGALSAGDLGAIADAQSFTPQQLDNASSAALDMPFFLGQALLRQAVARAADDGAKAELLAAALRLGRQSRLLPVAALMQEKALAQLAPASGLHAYAPAFIRALLLAHQADAAEKWRAILDPDNPQDRPVTSGLAVVLALETPDAGRKARAQPALAWLAQNALSPQPAGGADAQALGALALALWDGLGEPMPQAAPPPTEQPSAVQPQSAPSQVAPFQAVLAQAWPGRTLAPVLRKHLADIAGESGRKGEAVLAVLDAVGAQGPGDLSPDAAGFLVHALMQEGEGAAARALAADALLLRQPVQP